MKDYALTVLLYLVLMYSAFVIQNKILEGRASLSHKIIIASFLALAFSAALTLIYAILTGLVDTDF